MEPSQNLNRTNQQKIYRKEFHCHFHSISKSIEKIVHKSASGEFVQNVKTKLNITAENEKKIKIEILKLIQESQPKASELNLMEEELNKKL